MGHITSAMTRAGVTRLVSIGGAGLGLPGDRSSFGRRVIILLLKTFGRAVLAGKVAEWQVIRESGLRWTLVRPPRMVTRPTDDIRPSVDLHEVKGSPMVPYGTVARFMVDVAASDRFVAEAPFVAAGLGPDARRAGLPVASARRKSQP